jgi:hypothetical protein
MFFKKKKYKFKHYQNNFFVIDDIADLALLYKFTNKPVMVEDDLHTVNVISELNKRKILDANVLGMFAANCEPGNMLEIGTYYGAGTALMATNSPNSTIYTVNILPEQIGESAGGYTTSFLTKEQIGSFYKEKNLQNIKQIYANTKTWQVEEEVKDLSLVFIDGCHDTEFVYSDTRLILDRVKKGGFILWHDCSPVCRYNFEWVDASMRGIEKLIAEKLITGYILNVRNSWIGIWRKE